MGGGYGVGRDGWEGRVDTEKSGPVFWIVLIEFTDHLLMDPCDLHSQSRSQNSGCGTCSL